MNLPFWFVYPLITALIGGFIAWGEMSGSEKIKVEDDFTGLIVFSSLIFILLALFYCMYVRLDQASDPERRRRMYYAVDPKSPRDDQRHTLSVSEPWDSYQWAMGTLMVLISMIFWGVVFPVLHGSQRIFAYTWMGLFSVLWISVIAIMSYDPSRVVTDPKEIPEESRQLVTYCKLRGCQCWYANKYRKHCKACNKCVTGFDHHCPFLNQCIGDSNYKLFFVVLTTYNLVVLFTMAVGVWAIIMLWTPGTSVAAEGGRVW